MSIKKTIFGAKVPYAKQKFDGQLQLQQMPDTSAQAAQPFKEEIEAATVQHSIDRAHAEFAYEKHLEQASEIKENTLLAKLAPFSPIIQELTQIPIDKFEEWRDKQAQEEVGRQRRLAELEGGIEAMEANFSNPIVKSLGENPEASAHLRTKLFSMDLGMMRRVASYKVEAFAKDYAAGFAQFQASGQTITLPDATSPTGARELNVGSVSRAEEIDAVLRAYDSQLEALFANDPPEIYQEFKEKVSKERTKIKARLSKQVNGLRGAHVEAQALQSFDAGASMALTLQRIALSPTKDGIRGFPKALEILEKHIKLGISNGDYTLYHINEVWAKQSASLPGDKEKRGLNETYRRTMLNSLRKHWNETKDKRVGLTTAQNDAKYESLKAQVQNQVFVENQRPNKQMIEQIRRDALRFKPDAKLTWLDNIEKGYSTLAEEKDALQTHFDALIIQQRMPVDPSELQARLLNFPDLLNRYREQNARNNAVVKDPLITEGRKAIQGWLYSPSSTPNTGGGDFKYDISGPKGYASVVGIAKATAKYNEMVGTALAMMPSDATEEQKRQMIAGVGEQFKTWFNQERGNKNSPFYFGNETGVGGYYQIHRYSTGDGKSLSGNELENLTIKNSQRLQDFQQAAVVKFGKGKDALNKAFRDAETLSLLISPAEAEEAFENASQGKPLPIRFKYLTTHITGGNPLQLASLAVKTLTNKDLVFGKSLDNPAYLATFDMDQMNRGTYDRFLNRTGMAQVRESQRLSNTIPIPENPQATAAGQQGEPGEASTQVTMTTEQVSQELPNPEFATSPYFQEQLTLAVSKYGEEEAVRRLRLLGEKRNIEWLKNYTLPEN